MHPCSGRVTIAQSSLCYMEYMSLLYCCIPVLCVCFEFCNQDVTKFIDVPGELDYILHFASPASPIDYLKIPIQTLKVGSLGIHNCLGLAKAKKARILIASTSEVYGDPEVHPQTEEYWGHVNPVGPRGVYDEAKRFQEAITMAYHTFPKRQNPFDFIYV